MYVVLGLQVSVGMLAVAGFMSVQPGTEAVPWVTPAVLIALACGLIVVGLRRRVRLDEDAWSWTRCVVVGSSCVLAAIALGAAWGWSSAL